MSNWIYVLHIFWKMVVVDHILQTYAQLFVLKNCWFFAMDKYFANCSNCVPNYPSQQHLSSVSCSLLFPTIFLRIWQIVVKNIFYDLLFLTTFFWQSVIQDKRVPLVRILQNMYSSVLSCTLNVRRRIEEDPLASGKGCSSPKSALV